MRRPSRPTHMGGTPSHHKNGSRLLVDWNDILSYRNKVTSGFSCGQGLGTKGCWKKMGQWDLYMKAAAWESADDFVKLLHPEAHYVGMREGQFQTQELPEGMFKMREMRADKMIEAQYQRKHFLINLEVQSTKDKHIGMRLLGYGYEAVRAYKLPVRSGVLYLFHVHKPSYEPFGWAVPGLGVQVESKYASIEVAEMFVEELERTRLVGLAPLWVLTKDGATRDVVERAITLLEPANKPEGLAILRSLALQVVEDDATMVAWIKRRFAHMHDYLFENSIMYKELVAEGEVKGFEKGEIKGIRQSIEAVVQIRFPALLNLAREKIEHLQNEETLRNVHVAMVATSTERKARRYLMALQEQ